jgi:hypothetical protein
MILPQLLRLLEGWKGNFAQARTHQLAVQLALSILWMLGRNTISQRITLLRQHHVDWNRFYRFFSRRDWEVCELFRGVLLEALPWCRGNYIVCAADDTLAEHSGKQIYNIGYLRDPLSPKFRYNLVLGLRYLQISLLLPLYVSCGENCQACALPICFILAAVVRKPKGRKPLSMREEEQLAEAKRQNTLSCYLVDQVSAIRTWLNNNGFQQKMLLLVVDNGYCTATVFGIRLARVQILARARGNYRLYARDKRTGEAQLGCGFTPEEVRKDKELPWEKAQVHFGNGQTGIRYKEVSDLLWPGGAGKRRLRLIVIAGTPYRRRKFAAVQYRQPGYLLTTDLKAPVSFLIQSYFDRWQIEVNHREEKTVIGVNDAQVHTKNAVARAPGFAVAAYSMLKLATLQTMGPLRNDDYQELPAWYAGARRPSCEDMQQKIRKESWEHPEMLLPYGITLTPEALIAANRS